MNPLNPTCSEPEMTDWLALSKTHPNEPANITVGEVAQLVAHAKFMEDQNSKLQDAYEEQGAAHKNLFDMTGCVDDVDLIDKANVGISLLDRIGEVTSHGPFKGWAPADDPAEIATDAADMLEELETDLATARDRIAALEGALEPFAKMARLVDGPFGPRGGGGTGDDRPFSGGGAWQENGVVRTVTFGDLRRARALTTQSKEA